MILGIDQPAIESNCAKNLLGSLLEMICSENVGWLLEEPRGCVRVERGCVQSLSNGLLARVINGHG